jgi:hypothetical protein
LFWETAGRPLKKGNYFASFEFLIFSLHLSNFCFPKKEFFAERREFLHLNVDSLGVHSQKKKENMVPGEGDESEDKYQRLLFIF